MFVQLDFVRFVGDRQQFDKAQTKMFLAQQLENCLSTLQIYIKFAKDWGIQLSSTTDEQLSL